MMILFVQIPTTCAIETSNQDKALTFLTDVAQLDMSLYTVKLVQHDESFPPHLKGLSFESIIYDLYWKNESLLHITFTFIDNKFDICNILPTKGSPIYAEPQATKPIDSVKDILDRYLTYSQAVYIKNMQAVLNKVDSTNATATFGDVKLVTSTMKTPQGTTYEIFEWIYTIDGIDVQPNNLTVYFEDGVFKSLSDKWGLFKLGSSSVNISQEEAIDIAKKAANAHTLLVWRGEWVEIPFNLGDELSVNFFTYPRGEDLTVFPLWDIELYFDKADSLVNGLRYGIWADTGEIAFCNELSYGGESIGEVTSPTLQSDGSDVLILVVLAVIVAVVVASTVVLWKK
ncbi:MAG: hypothetical protein LBC12_00735 [Nitrososphaerota archaeon]|jgi:hypothetical protein|nr:hypothetical protein [Nitrososphaerota archaeon]